MDALNEKGRLHQPHLETNDDYGQPIRDGPILRWLRLRRSIKGLVAEEDYTKEGPVTESESAVLELLKARKEAELKDLYTNWTIES